MESKMQTGLLLILGAIVSAVAWGAISPADGTSSALEQAKDFMGDPDRAKIAVVLGYGGMIAVMIGLLSISRKMLMAGGSSSSYTNIATILLMAVVAIMLVGAGLELGAAGTTDAQTAATLMGIMIALTSTMGIPMGIALLLMGVAIGLEKNLHIGAAALLVVVGILLIISPPGLLFERGSDLANGVQMGGWMGIMLTGLIIGVLRLRQD